MPSLTGGRRVRGCPMRDLILWDMLSLDGMFQDPEATLDWFAFDDQLERYIIDTQRSAGTLVFGRRTYDMMVAHWPTAEGPTAEFMNAAHKVVFSRRPQESDWKHTEFVGDDVEAVIRRLKALPGGEIFVFGSADLSAELIRRGLVDEYRIGINPVLLGSGVPFFKGGHGRQPLHLTDLRRLDSGLVILHYRPDRGS